MNLHSCCDCRITGRSEFWNVQVQLVLGSQRRPRLFLRWKKQKALMMFKSMNGLAPEYVAQSMTWRTLRENGPYPKQVPTTWNAASLTAELWYGITCPKAYLLIILNNLLRRYLGLIYRIPTQQSCRTVMLYLVLVFYTCQLFLRYKREIFILAVPGILNTTRSFPKIPEEVRRLPKKSEVFRSLSMRTNASSLPVLFPWKLEIAIPYMGLS